MGTKSTEDNKSTVNDNEKSKKRLTSEYVCGDNKKIKNAVIPIIWRYKLSILILHSLI